MKIILLLSLFLIPIATFAEPSEDSQRLVEIFGWKDVYRGAVAPPGWADLPEKERKRFEEETAYPLDKLTMDLALWIDREFTEDERTEILSFLESEAGKKFSRIFFEDHDGTGEVYTVIGDWIAGRYHEMEAHLNGR